MMSQTKYDSSIGLAVPKKKIFAIYSIYKRAIDGPGSLTRGRHVNCLVTCNFGGDNLKDH